MEPIFYNINNATNSSIRKKMAAFDYDWTLVIPKDGKTFSTSMDDWKWYFDNIPIIIKKYYNDGYMIVIFSNQSKLWKHEQIKKVMETLEIPMFIVIAPNKKLYKPNPILFTSLVGDFEINKKKSFFVCDALGRPTDFSDSDKVFAENIGIKYYSPEEFFKNNQDSKQVSNIKVELYLFDLKSSKEIIIMVGYPGSGKSTIAKEICKNDNYILVQGDVYKTSTKMIKVAKAVIEDDNKCIIFDATNSSIKKRKEYIDFAKKYNYSVKCIHVDTSLEESFKRNKLRDEDKQIPKIAYSVYKKHFESPNTNEGFTLFTL